MGKYYSGIFVSNEALAHYGVKGQKWGVRRFQNEDGSYTPEGKERYNRDSSSERGPSYKQGPTRFGGGIGGNGKTGRMSMAQPLTNPVFVMASNMLINVAAYNHRRINAKKEIAEAKINEKKERITKDNLKHMCSKYNRKERRTIIDKMKNDPDISYDKARRKADDMYDKRLLRNLGIYLASAVAVPLALIYGPNAMRKAHDSLGKNKMFQEFLRSMKHRSMKDAIVLRKDEWEIDKVWQLPSGRG